MSQVTDLNTILHRVQKPARYTGGEWNSIKKVWGQVPIKVVLSYPDLYEIGMSNLALPILYDLLNGQPDVLAERVYAPWSDMEAVMRQEGIPLFSLESRHPLKEFDIIGFSLGYELTYTNVLNMLDLAQIPVLATERLALSEAEGNDSHPLIIAGGSGALNPEPMADFFDLFVVGDGEEVLLELVDCFRKWKQAGTKKEELLRQLVAIEGIYVPSFYQVDQSNGLIKSFKPTVPEAKPIIRRRIVSNLPPPVTRPVVPYIEVVHDRGAVEIQRGCSRGCRFCQAGAIYRPVRERPQSEVLEAVGELIANCGYSEVSLVSLSTTDYHRIDGLVAELAHRYPDLTISLPSLYVDTFSVNLMDSLPPHRKTGLTFAPEAGSERLRRVINKRISEDELLKTAALAFERGWTGLKLYFMLGLPGESKEDMDEIVRLLNKIRSLAPRGRTPQIRVTLSTFIPKPHTSFQWVAQENAEVLNSKLELLRQGLRGKGIKLSWQDPQVSQLEAVLSRGDRRLGKVIYNAWKLGCKFDSWGEHLNYPGWLQAFEKTGIDPAFYSYRQRDFDELMPWGHIDIGVTTTFLKQEYRRAMQSLETPDCRYDICSACGVQRWQPACRQKLNSKS